MKRMWKHLGKNKILFGIWLIAGIVLCLLSVIVPQTSGKLVTAIADKEGNVLKIGLCLIVVYVLQIVFNQIDLYVSNLAKIKQKQQMRNRTLQGFTKKTIAGAKERAEVSSFINNDIPSVVEDYFGGTIDIIKCVELIVLSGISLLYIHWIAAFIIVGISAIIVYLPSTVRKAGGEARKRYSGSMASYNASLQSVAGGIQILKTYQYRKRALELMQDADQEMLRKELSLLKYQMLVQGITTVLQIGKTAGIILSGVWMIGKGIISVGSLVTLIQLDNVIAAPIEVLAYLHHSRNAVRPLLDVYESYAGSEDTEENRESFKNKKMENEDISVENVSCKLGEVHVLKKVNVFFEAGKKYLITGASGSGKTTFLNILAQTGNFQYDGKVELGGYDIRKIEPQMYYKKVCPVFQEPYLFFASLEENIFLGRKIDRNIYEDTIKKLNLQYLLDRYQGQQITPEIVEKMSGGEKQRVAIARAMVGKPEVYLLDEITSALDKTNAEQIEKVLLKESACIIHVAHKSAANLENLYDKKFELENGELKEISKR